MKGREFDNIDKYIFGRMDREELQAFEKALISDVDLQLNVQIRKAVHYEINEEYRQELKSKLQHYDMKMDRENWLTPFIRIAAVVLIVMVGLYSTYKNYYQIDALEYDFYEEGINNYMNDNGDRVLFNNAMSHFRSEDYDEAIKEFEQLIVSNPTSDTVNYYLGVAYYREGRNNHAIKKLKSVLKNEYSIYHDKAYYRLGLCYSTINDKMTAKPIFEEIASDSSHAFSSEAKAILDNW